MPSNEVFCPHCGAGFVPEEAPTRLPRSPKQHRAFFRMVRIAADNWPETHPFQPVGANRKAREEHMRAWLLVQANHKMIIGEPLDKVRAVSDWELVKRYVAVAMQPSAMHPYRFPREDAHTGALMVDVPRSIDWAALSHEDFKPVFDEVMFIIERETGLKIEFIKQELRKFK